MAKSPLKLTRKEFHETAQPVQIQINGVTMVAEVKEFSTGSLGWYLNSKSVVDIGDKKVTVQIGMNITIIGSKEIPKDASHADEEQQDDSSESMTV